MANEDDGAPAEDALLLAARKGDRAALGALLERHQQQVFSFGMKMCGDPDDAREVAQDTLLSMVRSVRDFRGEASLSTCKSAPSPLVPRQVQESLRKAVQAALDAQR